MGRGQHRQRSTKICSGAAPSGYFSRRGARGAASASAKLGAGARRGACGLTCACGKKQKACGARVLRCGGWRPVSSDGWRFCSGVASLACCIMSRALAQPSLAFLRCSPSPRCLRNGFPRRPRQPRRDGPVHVSSSFRGSKRLQAQSAAVLSQGQCPGSSAAQASQVSGERLPGQQSSAGSARAWQVAGKTLPRQRASTGSNRSCFVSRAKPWLGRGSSLAAFRHGASEAAGECWLKAQLFCLKGGAMARARLSSSLAGLREDTSKAGGECWLKRSCFVSRAKPWLERGSSLAAPQGASEAASECWLKAQLLCPKGDALARARLKLGRCAGSAAGAASECWLKAQLFCLKGEALARARLPAEILNEKVSISSSAKADWLPEEI